MIIITGKSCSIYQIPPKDNIVQANPAIIFRSVCPDKRFENSRIDKLNTRAIYETSSIGTSKNASGIFTPLGRKKPKKWILCSFIAVIFIPMNNVSARLKVTKIWLVIVKL